MSGYRSPWTVPHPAQVEACELPEGHVWVADPDAVGCELCGEHYGWRCTVPWCFETVDGVFYDDPREVPPVIVAST